MQKNYPSIKTIMRIKGTSKESARLARYILKADTREQLESIYTYELYYQKYGKHMYNPHSLTELKLYMLDIVLDSYGVEAIQNKNNQWLEYLNFGDTYNATIIYYHDRFFVSSWGDVVEKEFNLWE